MHDWEEYVIGGILLALLIASGVTMVYTGAQLLGF